MSVINEMLRDLEQRKAPDRSDLDGGALNESLIESKPSHMKKYFLVVLLLLLALVIGMASLLLREQPLRFGATSEEQPDMLTVNQSSKAIARPEPLIQSADLKPIRQEHKQKQVASVANKIDVLEPERALKINTLKPNQQAAPIEAVASKASAAVNLSNAKPISAQVGYAEQSVKLETSVKGIPKAKTIETRQENPSPIVDVSGATPKPVVRLKPAVLPHERDQKMADLSRERFESGDARAAYRALYEFLEAYEVDQQSRIVLISYLLQDERIAEAGDVLVTTKVDESPELRQLKARWYVAKDEHKLALHTLRENLPELQRHPDYFALLASYYQRFGYPEKAAETYAELVKYDNESANWWAGLAIALDSSQQYQEAVAAYQQALAIPELSQELFEYIENRLSLLVTATRR